MNIQSLQIWKKDNRFFLKKIQHGPDLPRTGPIRRKTGPNHRRRMGSSQFKRPASEARLSAAPGGRRGMQQPRLSGLVRIDGRCSSSTRGKNRAAETLGFRREIEGAHRGVAGRRRRGSGGYVGFMWSWVIVGEAGGAPGDGVVERVLQVLRYVSAMATCLAGSSQNGEQG
jgi:hypothetical protein